MERPDSDRILHPPPPPSLLSPLGSVANTLKRALLIWFSVIIFGNSVTALSAVGTVTVLLGVLCYNRAQQREAAVRARSAPAPLPPPPAVEPAQQPEGVTVER